MIIPTPAEIQAIINSMPQNVGMDNAGIQTLIQWMHDNAVEMQPQHYTLTFTNVAAATTAAAQTIKIDSAAPFMLISQQAMATLNPVVSQTNRQVPLFGVQITDLQSGRNWQDSAAPAPNIFGMGERPYFYPQPRLMAANSALSVIVNNLDSATAYNLYLTFTGYRFYQGGTAQ